MKTTIYTVTMNRVFGAIDDLHTFVCKDEAEALVVEWANKNSTEDAPKFYTADEAIDWFSENDSEVEMTIDMHETEVDMASNDDYEMLASENKLMAEFIGKSGYTDEQISEIANTGAVNETTVAKAKAIDYEKRAEMIEKMVSKDIESILSSFKYGDTSFLDSVLRGDGYTQYNNLTDEQVLDEYNDRLNYWAEDESEPEYQIKTLDDAKALIGESVNVLDNNETNGFWGYVIEASENDIDGILVSVIDSDENVWDIESEYIVRVEADDENNTAAQSGQTHQCCDNCGTHESQYIMSQCPKCGYIGSKVTLSAVYPKVGMQVCVGGCDDNASAGQQRFVDDHFGQLFEVLDVGNYSSKLKNVPFRVKHAHVYEIVEQEEGK